MNLNELNITHFRNIPEMHLEFDPAYNLIWGRNAQGKTNILEAIWALSGAKSFRGSPERDYLPHGGRSSAVQAVFTDRNRRQTLALHMTGRQPLHKKYTVNGVERSGSDLFELFHLVVFTPDDLSLITGAPERRRSFLDLSNAQLAQRHLTALRRYNLVLRQRNALFRQEIDRRTLKTYLNIYNRQLVPLGAELTAARCAYLHQLQTVCAPLYQQISGGQEALELRYSCGITGKKAENPSDLPEPEKIEALFMQKLEAEVDNDCAFGHTTTGAHRDDVGILLDGKPAKLYGSQGQKKSVALTMKLAQAQIYAARMGESPIVLLDDVMGELDSQRQAVVSALCADMQVFVTTCQPEAVRQGGGRRFRVENGAVHEIESLQDE